MSSATDFSSRPQGFRHELQILQLNMRSSSMCLSLLEQFLCHRPIDVLLLQDLPDRMKTVLGGIPGYSTFLPFHHGDDSQHSSPLVAILVRHPLHARPVVFDNQRMCGVFLHTPLGLVACISAYIHFRHGLGLDALSCMLTKVKQETPFIFLGADTNGHSAWWGPPDQILNETGQLFEDLILTQNL